MQTRIWKMHPVPFCIHMRSMTIFIYTEGGPMLEASVRHTGAGCGKSAAIPRIPLMNQTQCWSASLNPVVNGLHAREACSSPYRVTGRLPTVIQAQSRKGLHAMYQRPDQPLALYNSENYDIEVFGVDKDELQSSCGQAPKGECQYQPLGCWSEAMPLQRIACSLKQFLRVRVLVPEADE